MEAVGPSTAVRVGEAAPGTHAAFFANAQSLADAASLAAQLATVRVVPGAAGAQLTSAASPAGPGVDHRRRHHIVGWKRAEQVMENDADLFDDGAASASWAVLATTEAPDSGRWRALERGRAGECEQGRPKCSWRVGYSIYGRR